MSLSGSYEQMSLLERVADGDEHAFRELFDNYKERFYAVVFKMIGSHTVAEDIVQDVFITIWNKREQLREVENPSSYFFTIVYRRVYRHFEKTALDRSLFRAVKSSYPTSSNNTEETVSMREVNQLISSAVSRLPAQQKKVFILSKQSGLTRDDIATKLQISPNTVRNHLSAAMTFIKNFLEGSVITLFIFQSLFW